IIIIDDHPLFRDSTKQMITGLAGYEVAGTAGDAREGEKLAMEQKPDVAIVDLSLPDKSGIQLTRTLTTLLPEMKIVIISMHTKIDYIINALRAGALGYVAKDFVTRSLPIYLETVLQGNHYLDPSLSQEIASRLLDIAEEDKLTDSGYGGLSPREQEVLRLLAQGVTSRDIAEKLFISPKTVANHRANILGKLDLHSTAELVRYAVQLGICRADM
ncbi:MAG: response regulator transcription factor, partial [Proteobacteria bacterium]|nr:response regulator transcription factor [Pseudomonadota bacterium]MBU1641537.1 response regulator transcription factor [Pseudomonadota bacterium]